MNARELVASFACCSPMRPDLMRGGGFQSVFRFSWAFSTPMGSSGYHAVHMKMMISAGITAIALLAACAGAPDDALENDKGISDMLLERPRFDKPVRRPLAHILIRWNRVQGADGYELQSSETRDFSNPGGFWTTSSTSVELPLSGGAVMWFQVRSFDENSVSRWSSPLRVKEGEL